MALSKSHQHFGHLVQKFRSAECQGNERGSYFLARPQKDGTECANNIPSLCEILRASSVHQVLAGREVGGGGRKREREEGTVMKICLRFTG